MSDDLVHRLHNLIKMDVFEPDVGGTTMLDAARMTMLESADRIEALEARYEAWKSVADGHLMRVKELEAALREIAENSKGWSANQLSYVAHAALEGKE